MTKHSNVDVTELDKFNRTVLDWWSPNGAFRTLHHINRARLDFITSSTPLENAKILDVGCGGGILTESMAKLGADVTGVDLAEEALAVATQHARDNQVACQYHCAYIEEWAEQHRHQYDIVTCMEMLEHVPDPKSIVQACATAVKPGGWIFFSTINRTMKAYLFAILGAEYILGLIPKKTHDYDKFIKPSELASWCREAALPVSQLQGLTYNPLHKTASLSHSLDINYLVACQAEILLTIS